MCSETAHCQLFDTVHENLVRSEKKKKKKKKKKKQLNTVDNLTFIHEN